MTDSQEPVQRNVDRVASQRLTKVTRPHVDGALTRQHLFEELDAFNMPLVWISAPGGYGKTTLVSTYVEARQIPCLWYQIDGGDTDLATFFHYLGLAGMQAAPEISKPLPPFTPDYLLGIPEFSRNFFGELGSRLAVPSILVFDNCQQIEDDALFYTALLEGMTRLPEGVRIFLVSRSDPPPVLARLLIHRRLKTFGVSKLRMTKEEFLALAEAGGVAPGEFDVHSAYRRMDGWAAGLALVLEHLKMFRQTWDSFDQFTPEGIFDYFAGEIFAKLDSKIREFLMKVALLPDISVPMAEQLTDNPQSRVILHQLFRQNQFTNMREQPSRSYQFHPLFRQFLLKEMQEEFSPDEIVALQRSAANLLVQTGRFEPAVELLSVSRDWEGLIGIILGQAQALLQQGRIQTLANWINRLPPEIVENVPWLSYWLGIARLPLEPPEAQRHFERSFEQFTLQQDDSPGRALAWAGILDSIVYGFADFRPMDQWLARIDEIVGKAENLAEGPVGAKISAAIFLAMAHRNPSHPKFHEWENRALELIETTEDPYCKIQVLTQAVVLQGCRGHRRYIEEVFGKVQRLLNDPGAPPFVRISALFAEFYATCWIGNNPEHTAHIARRALLIANESGVHLMDALLTGCGIYGELMSGNLKGATDLLGQMHSLCESAGPFYLSFYHHQRSNLALLKGEYSRAAEHGERSLELTDQCGFVHGFAASLFQVAMISLAKGETEPCLKHLDTAEPIFHSAGWDFFLVLSDLARAQSHLQVGDIDRGIEFLRLAFRRARKHSIIINYVIIRPWLASLCALALANNIETEFVKSLIRRMKLIPDEPPIDVEQWPWILRIYTLGRFEIVCEDRPLRFSGKAQQRPLALLKVIIAMGGTGVSEVRIADALWPDADGDMARKSLKAALHRLRKLLAVPEAIRYSEGALSLDPRFCWTDVWALERLLKPAANNSQGPKDFSELRRGLDLYKGTFLAEEESAEWAITTREKLRSRYLRAAEIFGDHLERSGRTDEAIELYLQALEVDPHIERSYQRLMLCYLQQERPTAALKTYERCHQVLGKTLSIKPSSKTESIRKSILAAD